MAGFDPNSNEITTDAEYLLKNPGYIRQAHDLLVKYGIIPASGWGSDAATAEEVNANPYSVAKLLGKSYQTNLGSNMNQANAHGALFSGAYVNNQAHSLDDYQHGMSDAGTNLMSDLGGVSDARTGTLVDIWNRLSNQPISPDTSVGQTPNPTTNAPAGGITAIGTGTNTPIPQGPYQRTGPEAGGLVVKPKAKPKPVVGGMGHQT